MQKSTAFSYTANNQLEDLMENFITIATNKIKNNLGINLKNAQNLY